MYQRANQGGSIVVYAIVSVILALATVGGVYAIQQRASGGQVGPMIAVNQPEKQQSQNTEAEQKQAEDKKAEEEAVKKQQAAEEEKAKRHQQEAAQQKADTQCSPRERG